VSDLDDLIARIRLDKDVFSRDLDMEVAKRLVVIPSDAEWGNGHLPYAGLPPDTDKFLGDWTTPAHKEYETKRRTLRLTNPTRRQFAEFEAANPQPENPAMPWSGHLLLFRASFDAAISLIPKAYHLWRFGVAGEGPFAEIASGYAPEHQIYVKTTINVPTAIVIAALLTLERDDGAVDAGLPIAEKLG
jgi:hypothetical protein